MSPFLFILVMEGLNSMLKVASTNGWIKGFDVARNNIQRMEITNLQYADDTIICGAEEEELKYLRVILILFEASQACMSTGGRATSIPSTRFLIWNCWL